MTSLRRLLAPSLFFFLFCPALLHAAAIGYLRIEGIQGEVSVAPYEDHIEILGFGQGITNPLTTPTGETSDGRPVFQDIRVTKAIDSTSPLLYMRIAQATVIPTVEFKFLKDGVLYYTIELTDAVITGVVPSMGSAVSTEMISFAFKRIQWTITSGGVTSGWDVTTNTPL